MDKILQIADDLANAIVECDTYREYAAATKAIRADKELSIKVENFKRRHLAYAINKSKNRDSFEEERYLSQEYYKIILNEDAKTYFEDGLKLLDIMDQVYKKISSNYVLDVFLGDEQ